MSTIQYRINSQIQAKEVRLLREDGTQVGVVTREQVLEEAKKLNVDAVEIAPMAVPPVVKLIDYKKFKYQLAKKEQVAKASQKKVDLKEIRLTPFMAENDFQVKVNRAKGFLADGHKVRVTVKFMGRQLSKKEFGGQMMDRAYTALSDISIIDQQAKWVGRQLIATISPTKKK